MYVTHLLVACLCCAAATNSASTNESDLCGQTIENVNFADDGDAKQRTSPWMVVLGIYEQVDRQFNNLIFSLILVIIYFCRFFNGYKQLLKTKEIRIKLQPLLQL